MSIYGMISSLIKLYDFHHMMKTSECFGIYARDIEDAINELQKLGEHIKDNYKGQASSVADDVIIKLREHLYLLHSCGDNTRAYIAYVAAQALMFDKKMAS